ncbi:tetratricopeptide repeat-containing sensor histidine kinase [Epilithonimonas vandammei]|uniref:tetratricopeptide repeat-containing sensor histidine kinase n=1 Tax=Epilithonimonas vandammei TaxID=2487072 RepID=UPI00289FA062|nr:tetratricopeptide repeat protein [Epilithonimonas vandammei]
MKIRIFLILFCISLSSFAQKHEIDSLKQLLRNYKKTDTTKFLLYYDISRAYDDEDDKLSLKYSDSALYIAPKLENKNKWLAKVFYRKGQNYYQYFHYKESLDSYQKAIHFALKGKKTDELLGRIYHNTGLIYQYNDEYKKALGYHQKAFELFVKIKNEKLGLTALNSVGACYTNLNDYKKALNCYFQVLKIAETQNNESEMGLASGNIGLVFKRIGNFEKAYAYFEKAIAIYSKINDMRNLINTYQSYGTAKDSNNDQKGAIKLYEKGLRLATKPEYDNLKYDLINGLGVAYLAQKNYEKAIDFLKQSLVYYRENENKRKLSITNLHYSEVLTEAPDEILKKNNINPSEKYNLAISLLKENVKIDEKLEIPESLMYDKELLAKIYEKKGDYKNALHEFKDFQRLKDSLAFSENREEAIKKEMQYNADKKETLAKAEIGKQKVIRNAIVTVSLIVLIAGVFLFLGFRKRQKIKAEQKEILLKAEISETELKALRAQMNPHFIFNALNSIADYINKNDARSADYYLGKFAKLMRGILENSEEKEISLSEELKMLEFYMDLESLRFKNKFNYEVKIADDINPENTLIPPMILQPFVENSILHGLAKKENDGKITIHIDKTEDLLKCTIEDNGIGRKNPNENLNKSYGVKLTRERIALFDKSKNSDSGVFYTDLETGTRVELRLPLEEI